MEIFQVYECPEMAFRGVDFFCCSPVRVGLWVLSRNVSQPSLNISVPLSTNIYYPALITIQNEFQTSPTLVNATVTCYVLLIGWGPLVWSAIADVKGRKITYILSLSIFLITSLATAFATSIEMLLGLRVAQAIGGSSVLAVGAGSISDLFPPSERGTAMGWYILGPQIGVCSF